MSEKNIKSRIVHKHDIEANWLLATNFSPRAGEFIIYDPDENNPHSRVKIGDGKTNVNDLPFIESSRADKATEADHATQADTATNANHAVTADTATNADTVGGKSATDFALAADLDVLEELIGDTAVSIQISEAIANIDTEVSWNDLTDKPFGEKEVGSNILIWDCDTTGKESPDGMMYFVCDAEVTYEELKKSAVVEIYSDGSQIFSFDFITQINDSDVIITEAFAYAKFDGAKLGNITYPKRGFYCYPNGDEFRIILDESVKPFKTIETVPIDTKYLPDVVSDWNQNDETALNYIKNKPFGEYRKFQDITWDGNSDGLESANTGMMIWCYKMTEDYSYLEPTDFIGATFRIPIINDLVTITEEHISDDGLSVVVIVGGYVVFAFIKDGGSAQYIGSNPGLWLYKNSGGSYTDVVSFPSEIKTIDPKYLPNNGIINWNDLEGKPFDISIISDQQIFEGTEFGPVMVTTPIVEGQKYIVIYNGTEYECIARNYDGYLMLGNNAIYEYDGDINIDTGEPFAIEWYGEALEGSGYSNKDIQHTIQIKSIRTLDLQYLPEHSHSWNDLVGRPFGEDMPIRDYLYNGEMMFEADDDISGSGYYGVGEIFCSDRNKYSYDDKLFIVIDGEEYLLNDLLELPDGVHTNGAWYVGNSALVQSNGADTGENYYIHWTGTSNIFMLHIYHRNEGTHNIEVYVEYPGIKTIDPKYLPVDDIIVAEADHAVSADSATKATQDGNGKVISDTYETKADAQAKLETAKSYTDAEITEWVGDKTVASQISTAVSTKANTSDLTSHTGNTTVHITSTERSNWNAAKTHADSAHAPSNAQANQNAFSNVKVGSTTVAADTTTDTLELAGSNVTITPDTTNDKITIGITKANVTSALGYTPPTTNTTYDAAGSSLGLVKSGGDVTIASGVITVNDDSHAHVISNVDGLQTALDAKATASDLSALKTLVGDTAVSTQINTAIAGKSDTGHTHDDRYYTESEIDTKLGNKVDKVSGKGLSTNDLTATLKSNYDAAYTHVSATNNPHGVTKSQVG